MATKKSIITISVIAFIMLAGLSGPTYLFSITRADYSQIQLPGTPINETQFDIIVNDTIDCATFTGSYEQESSRPYVLRFNPPTSDPISQDDAINISLEFVPFRYRNYLNFTHWTEFNPNLPEWTIRFTSHKDESEGYYGLVIVTKINAITGRITGYHVHWDEHVDTGIFLPPIQPDETPVNYSVVEDKLIQFLRDNGYTLPAKTRFLEAYTWPNETEAEWYMFKLVIPTESISPDEAIQGVEARVDAVTGEILDFTYSNIELPLISTDGVIDPNFVLSITNDNSSFNLDILNADYIGAFLRLRLIETASFPVRMQLVWAFRFIDEEGWYYEVHRDAYNGGIPIPSQNVLYSFTRENSLGIVMIPIFACVVSSIIFLSIHKYYDD